MINPMRVLLATLLVFLQVTFIGGIVQASEVVTRPLITYQDNTGLKLQATPGKWSTPVKSSFQWFVNDKPVAGATGLKFTASSKQRNQSIYFKESIIGNAKIYTTSAIGRIGQVIINQAPVVKFKDESRSSLTLTPGITSPTNAKVNYQWYRGPIEINGARNKEYVLATSDQGTRISISAVYSLKGFTGITSNSNILEIPQVKREYVQKWQEEFNLPAGSLPDSSIWTADNGDGTNNPAGGGWGNRERQYYAATQAKTSSSGELVIEATRSGASQYNCYYKGPCEWLSAKYISKGKLGFKYGRIEARIKGPAGLGTWGAFWMLGADIDERRWPWCGEIDVTELVGKDPKIAYGYLHGLLSGGAGGRGTTVAMPQGFSDDFHVYAIDWLPDQINWYVDGVLFGSQTKIDKDWVFDHEFYLIFNLAMGGNLGGAIDPSLAQATMSIDWIRFSTINGVGEIIRH